MALTAAGGATLFIHIFPDLPECSIAIPSLVAVGSQTDLLRRWRWRAREMLPRHDGSASDDGDDMPANDKPRYSVSDQVQSVEHGHCLRDVDDSRHL